MLEGIPLPLLEERLGLAPFREWFLAVPLVLGLERERGYMLAQGSFLSLKLPAHHHIYVSTYISDEHMRFCTGILLPRGVIAP
jgi:hypothetical protein